MTGIRVFFCLLRWDILREVRRKESVLNMILFSVLILFLVDLGLGPLFEGYRGDPDARLAGMEGSVGPVVFWVTVLFAGTVGLSQSFAAEREGDALEGILMAPVDTGVFYLAKVVATWIYVSVMEVILVAVYAVFFPFDAGVLAPMAVVLAVFTFGYLGAGVVLVAMTSALRRGGEVVLRILLFPLLMPMLYLTLRLPEGTFGVDVVRGALGPPLEFSSWLAAVLAIDCVYVTAGFLLFPKIFEE